MLLRQYCGQRFPCSALVCKDCKVCNPESDIDRSRAPFRVLLAYVNKSTTSIFFNNVQTKAILVFFWSLKFCLNGSVSRGFFEGFLGNAQRPGDEIFQIHIL